MSDTHELERIAIIGMSGRFPGARNLDEFWRNLRDGKDCVRTLSEEELLRAGVAPQQVASPNYVRKSSEIDDVELFDASFFGFSPREAEILDPQHRVFMECCWEALEQAGYVAEDYPGWVGLWAGVSTPNYFMINLISHPELFASVGGFPLLLSNDRDYFTTRVSYKLNLRGPSMNVQTACSTSLVAVHMACQSLLAYQCTIALAGGVRIGLPLGHGYTYLEGSIFSPDGRCRAFDAGANGSLFGDGVGVVALKRLSEAVADGDPIHAVILASAINNDGSCKVGFTAPSVEGQAEAIAMAHGMAGVAPESIAFIETHGTGTPLGDPIEVRALTEVLGAGTEERQFCALGSVKTNVGHLEAAAGIAGLIKTVLALEHRQIPPNLHFEKPNPQIDFEHSPFYVSSRLADWPRRGDLPRRAAVSSFGMGGTNAHAVLEEAPERPPAGPSRPWQLLALSARTPTALEAVTDRLAAVLQQPAPPPLADVAFTLQQGRRAFELRRTLVCRDAADAAAALAGRDPSRLLDARAEAGARPVTLLCSGVGEQYPGMGRGLYASEPTFRQAVDECCELLRAPLGLDLRTLLLADEAVAPGGGLDLRSLLGRGPVVESEAQQALNRTALAQPAVFVLDYAVAQLWREWGLEPESLIGYSLGEYVAACLAGVLALEDALRLVARRAQLIEELPEGAMLALPLPAAEARQLLGAELDLAASNGATLSVVAGPPAAVAELEARLAERGVSSRRLATRHAFHSRMMEPIRGAFLDLVRGVELRAPEVPYLSNVTGTWIKAEEATDPEHWARHMCQTVRFAEGLAELAKEPSRVLIEVGPGRALTTLALQSAGAPAAGAPARLVLPSVRSLHERQDDGAFLLTSLAQLWLAGVPVDWAGFATHEQRQRLWLPTYPFERQRYWIDMAMPPSAPSGASGEDAAAAAPAVAPGALHQRPGHLRNPYVPPSNEMEQQLAAIWQDLLGVQDVGIHDDFFQLGGHSLLAPRLLNRLRQDLGVELPMQALFQAPTVAQLGEAVATVRREGSVESLLAGTEVDLRAEVVLAPSIRPEGRPAPGTASQPRAVLLTGATGFLGAFLLDALLRQTSARVFCVVRAEDRPAAERRLRRQLEGRQLWRDEDAGRIVTVVGDLAEPRWGLDEQHFHQLAAEVDAIYHCGAWVNFTYPYSVLKPSNVEATREAIRMACLEHPKPLHFISSVAVFSRLVDRGDAQISEDDPLAECRGLFAGYGESKWVGEKLVGLARERGLQASIYRPGVVGGHSRTGVGNTSDFVWALLKGAIQIGSAPTDWHSQMDVAPVDYVAGGIVALSLQEANLGRTYHFPNPRPLPWTEAFECARNYGYPLRRPTLLEWQQELTEVVPNDPDHALAPFLPMLMASAPASGDGEQAPPQEAPPPPRPRSGSLYNDAHTQAGLAGTGITCPPVSQELLDVYLDYFVRVGYLQPPPARA